MKGGRRIQQHDHKRTFSQSIHPLPLSWLNYSFSKRLLIVLCSYWLGIVGLWFLFPRTHNGGSMFLPIVCACWLFRYRGLVISLIFSGIAFQLTYLLLLRGMLPDQAFIEGGIIGFGTSLGLGLVICWLRTTVELLDEARQQSLALQQEHLQAQQAERQLMFAYEQQRKVNELKDQILQHVSHELRTPLTVLGSFLELLEVHFEHIDHLERKQALKRALASYQELVGLVNQEIDAITTAGTFPIVQCERVSVLQAVQEVLERLDPRDVEAYVIHLQIDAQVLVWADPHYLYRVLQNVFSNIFKYVPTQTTIRIEAMQATPTSPVCLSIQDAGPGIPPDELSHIFEKLVRLKRDIGGPIRGTGLGLSICKQLIEAMGGHIWAESSGRMGEGSRICMTLPLFEDSALPSPTRNHPS